MALGKSKQTTPVFSLQERAPSAELLDATSITHTSPITRTARITGSCALPPSSSACRSSPSRCAAWSRSRPAALPPCLLLIRDAHSHSALAGTHFLRVAATEKDTPGIRFACSGSRAPFRGRSARPERYPRGRDYPESGRAGNNRRWRERQCRPCSPFRA